MTDFMGVSERESLRLKNFSESRLRRLQEVRLQEKLLSSNQCTRYRRVIGARKQIKTEIVKENLISQKKSLHDDLVQARQRSLIDAGHAHRTAIEKSNASTISRIRNELARIQDMNAANQRGIDANIAVHKALDAQRILAAAPLERNKLRLNMIASDREDARATAEARSAYNARKIADAEQKLVISPHKYSNVQQVTQQSAVRIQDRGSVKTRTNIVRYGRPGVNEQSLLNRAAVEEKSAMLRRWAIVMKEMIHRKGTECRDRDARKGLRTARQIDKLEGELALLTIADKSSRRALVAKSAALIRSDLHRSKESPSAVREFEEVFLFPPRTHESASILDATTTHVTDTTGSTDVSSTDVSNSNSLSQRQPPLWIDGHQQHLPVSDSIKSNQSIRRTGPYAPQRSSYDSSKEMLRGSRSYLPVGPVDPPPPPIWSIPPVEFRTSYPTRESAAPIMDIIHVERESIDALQDARYPSTSTQLADISLPLLHSFDEGTSMFRSSSEQESEVEGTLGALLGESTSTAPTISARHDRMRLSSSSMRQLSLRSSLVYEAPPMEYQSTQELKEESVRTSSSSTSFSHKQKVRGRYLDTSSLSGLGSMSRSSMTYSKNPNESTTSVFLSLELDKSDNDNDEDDGDGDGDGDYQGPLGVTVKIRTLPTSGASTGGGRDVGGGAGEGEGVGGGVRGVVTGRVGGRSGGCTGVSIDTFEAFFEDEEEEGEEEDEEEEDKEELRGSRDRVGLERSVPSSAGPFRGFDAISDSARSPRSRSRSSSQGESELDDNMSAITWPDLGPRKDLGPPDSRQFDPDFNLRESGQAELFADIRIRQDDSSRVEKVRRDRLRESIDLSLEGDGFLHELDALSHFWAQRRKGNSDKEQFDS